MNRELEREDFADSEIETVEHREERLAKTYGESETGPDEQCRQKNESKAVVSAQVGFCMEFQH